MIRYTKQYDQYSCGPVVVVNALKWDNRPISWRKNKKQLIQRIGTSRETGSRFWAVYDTLLAKFGSRVRMFWRVDFHLMNLALRKKGFVILSASWRDDPDGHYFAIDGITPKGYYVINYDDNRKARHWISWKKLYRSIRWHGTRMMIISPTPKKFYEY